MTFGVRLALRPQRAIQLCSVVTFLLISGLESNGYALDAREYAVEASVEVLNSPFRLRLTWRPSPLARSYTIKRRDYLSADWGSVRATLPAGTSEYVDTQVTEGKAYEYEIQMEATVAAPGGWVNAYGYVLAGSKVSWPDQKGKVLLLVDPLVLPTLNPEIDRFQKDLIGAGWTPIRRDLDRLSTVSDVKNLVRAEYNADRANVKAVVLLGHLPVPYSGNIAPDLHPSHKGAWPADVYYAEMDGTWTDSTVDIVSGDSRSNDNRPGDGKFDQSQIPSHVELEIGRIDFANLPSFTSTSAVDLLRRYLQKNHDFRHRAFTSVRRGLIRDNFGDLDGDAPAVDAWRHYPQFFGPGQVREVGPGGFFSTLSNESFLWAYGCGGGGNNKADGVGTTTDFATQSPRAVFLMLHGSYFGDWNVTDNFLRAGIASSGDTLASIWSGLPHWYMHPMGLGASIGACTRLTQNNINQYRSHQNISAQQVHISLIGDPTLEMLPVIPARNFAGSAGANVNLTWLSSTDESIVGYHVYHSSSAAGPFNRVTASPISTTSFSHAAGIGTHHYMVRAVKLERTGSGTFYNLSQGVFTSVTKTSGGVTPQVTIVAEDGNVSEAGPNTGTIRISRNVADQNPLTVELLIGGTAQNGIDYDAISLSVVIPAWANDARITVVPRIDNTIEGTENLTIQISPSVNYTVGDTHSVVLDILDLNRPPTISQISDQTIESGTISSALSFEVNDLETSAAALQMRAQTSNADLIPPTAIVFGGNGSNRTVQIEAATNSGTGVAQITLLVSDGVNEASSAFDVTVTPLNLPPVAHSQNVATIENQSLAITLAGHDPEEQTLSFFIKSSPVNGILSGTAPNLIYTPSENLFGVDSFTFTVSDGRRESVLATVTITVTEQNRPPIASPQTVSTTEDQPVVIELAGSDPNDDSLTFEIVVQPARGHLDGTNNIYRFVPNTNAFGSDSFSFHVRDGEFVSAPAIVDLNIIPTNDAPSAVSEQLLLDEDETVFFTLKGIDPDGDMLTFAIRTSPAHGVVNGTPPNLSYTPRSDFNGQDTLQFTVRDGTVTSEVATVSFMIAQVNDAPSASNKEVLLEEDTSIAFTLSGADRDGDLVTFEIVAPPKNGTVTGTIPQLSYQPVPNYHGGDSIKYIARDGTLNSEVATVSFLITPVNDAPTASDQIFFLDEEEVRTLKLQGRDADGDAISYQILSPPTNGVLNGTAPDLTYQSKTNFFGDDSLQYVVTDGMATSTVATVSFTVLAVNDPPAAIGQELSTDEDTLMNIQLRAVDPDGDLPTLSIVTHPQHGSISGTPPNLIYTPETNFNGSDSFTFRARDATEEGDPGWVTITVLPRNDPPVVGVLEDQTISKNDSVGPLNLELSDVDHEISKLTFAAASSNTDLIATSGIRFEFIGTNPVVTLEPAHGMTGTARITLNVSDGEALASTSFELTVTNTPPIPIHDFIDVSSGVVNLPVLDLLANDRDSDGDPLRIVSVSNSLRGHLVVLTNDTIIYYGDGAGGEDSFTYIAEDSSQETGSAGVWLNLTAKPQIRSVSIMEGDVVLRFTGEPRRIFKVWSSPDTVHWENLGSGTSSGTGTAQFTHTNGAHPAHRFYRVEWP